MGPRVRLYSGTELQALFGIKCGLRLCPEVGKGYRLGFTNESAIGSALPLGMVFGRALCSGMAPVLPYSCVGLETVLHIWNDWLSKLWDEVGPQAMLHDWIGSLATLFAYLMPRLLGNQRGL